MNTVVVLTVQIVALWMVVVGIAHAIGGVRLSGPALRWPVRTGYRLLRRAVGGLLAALGNWIHGP